MKSGGEFSHLKAIVRSLKETVENIAEDGYVREWQDSGVLAENSPVAFTASNIEKSFIQEPIQGMAGGIVHFFGESAKQTDALIKKAKTKNPSADNPISRAGVFGYYLAKNTIVGTGENLGEGVAEMYTARTSDQLVEGLSRFYGGVAGGAGLMAGGAAGASATVTIPTLTATGSGVGGLALEATAVSAPASTATVGAIASGALVHASVGSEPGIQGSGGGGRGSPPRAIDSPQLNWHGHKTQVRVKTNQELVDWANGSAARLGHNSLSTSRPVGELMIRELRRRSKEGVDHVGQKIDAAAQKRLNDVADRLERAIQKARPELDYFQQQHMLMKPAQRVSHYTSSELTNAAKGELHHLAEGLDRGRVPYQKALAQELRERSLAFEGEEASTMCRLANEIEGALEAKANLPAQILDLDDLAGGFDDKALLEQAEGILSPRGSGVGGPELVANLLRERAAFKPWLEARKWRRLAEKVERRGRELRAQGAQRIADGEEAFRASEVPSVVEHRPVTDLPDADLTLFLDTFSNPSKTGFSPYPVEALLEEIARRAREGGLK